MAAGCSGGIFGETASPATIGLPGSVSKPDGLGAGTMAKRWKGNLPAHLQSNLPAQRKLIVSPDSYPLSAPSRPAGGTIQ